MKASLFGGVGLALLVMVCVAQQTVILFLKHDGTLTWSNSMTNVYCGLEAKDELAGYWCPAPPPFWNILVTNRVMSVVIPMGENEGEQLFVRLVSSTNRLTEYVYDVASNGIPRFVGADYIELAKITRISRFRSGIGHDYSDDFESCRSMKHYFQPDGSVDWAKIQIRAPVAGIISQLKEEWAGTQVQIRSADLPAFTFVIFHVTLTNGLTVGDAVAEGELLGTHIGAQTTGDIAVGVNTPTGYQLLSYFDVMRDELFATYEARGLASRSNAIITEAERNADPLRCNGESFETEGNLPNWVNLSWPP
jgi:hypothetical protein